MEENKKRRLKNCTFVKTVLMLLVIVYHCCVFWTGTWFTKDPVYESRGLAILSSWLNSFHIYGFTFASGYIYSSLRNDMGKYRDRKAFIIGKAKRLIIPFYFVVLVWVIPIQQYFFHYDIKTIVRNFILAKSPNQLWFLWMLFCTFMIICFIVQWIDKYPKLSYLIAVVSYILFHFLRFRITDYFQFIMSLQFLPFFLVGYSFQKKDFNEKKWPLILGAQVLLFVIFAYWRPENFPAFRVVRIVLEFLLHMTGALMAFVVLQALANVVKWEDSKVFMLLSKRSMPMYLFHQQLIYFSIVFLNGKVIPELNALVNLCVAVLGSLLISSLLVKTRITRMLIGEK